MNDGKTRISPLSPKNFDIETIYNNISKDSIENTLLEYDYLSLGKIIVENESDKYAKYIIALNKYGQVVIVELDISGVSLVSDRDYVIKQTDASDIPDGIVLGTIDLVGQNVDGVLFIYDNGVATVYTDIVGHIYRDNYKYTRSSKQELELSHTPIPYIIIKYSSIKDDTYDTTVRAYTNTIALRNDTLKNCKNVMSEFLSNLDDVNTISSDCYHKIFSNTERLFDELSNIEHTLTSLCFKEDHAADKYEYADLLNRASNINDIVITLMEVAQNFKHHMSIVQRLYQVIQSSNSDIEDSLNMTCNVVRKSIENAFDELDKR